MRPSMLSGTTGSPVVESIANVTNETDNPTPK